MTITVELIIQFLIFGAAIALAAYLLPFVYIRNFSTAVVVGVLIAIVNGATIWLLNELNVAVNMNSLTLASLLLTVITIMIVDKMMRGFRVKNFLSAAVFAIFVIFINFGLTYITEPLF